MATNQEIYEAVQEVEKEIKELKRIMMRLAKTEKD